MSKVKIEFEVTADVKDAVVTARNPGTGWGAGWSPGLSPAPHTGNPDLDAAMVREWDRVRPLEEGETRFDAHIGKMSVADDMLRICWPNGTEVRYDKKALLGQRECPERLAFFLKHRDPEPKPLTVEEAVTVYVRFDGSQAQSFREVLAAERKRQAEIAAWKERNQ